MNCCDANGDCNQGRSCPARAFPVSTAQGIKSPESATDVDDLCAKLETTEAVLVWLVVLACTAATFYLIVVFLQFIGV